MDIHVAVETTSVIPSGARSSRGGIRTSVMPGADVALLTEAGHLDPEQADDVRAMGLVTVHAALQDGRMRPEERSPLVRVAADALLVEGDRVDELLGGRPMRVVAARAGHRPGLSSRSQGHVGRSAELHGPHLMALAAQVIMNFVEELPARVVLIKLDDLELSLLGRRPVDRMAGHAGDVA